MVVAGSGTRGRSQVHMKHFERVALTLASGEEGTVVERDWGEWAWYHFRSGIILGVETQVMKDKMSQEQELLQSYFTKKMIKLLAVSGR